MTEKQKSVNSIIFRASTDTKENHEVYENYKSLLQDLDLDPKEYAVSVRKLAAVLRV